MDELKKISDRITVMRDGTYVDTVNTKDVEIKQIISMMVGRQIYVEGHAKNTDKSQPLVLEVKNLNSGRQIKNVSFDLHKGEILGFAGLMGAGRTEVARAIFGADKYDSGDIFVNGKQVHIKSPQDAVAHGIGYLSEDRKRYGVALGLDVATNTVMASMSNFSNKIGWIDDEAIQKQTDKMVAAMSTKTPNNKQRVKNLSGGNQQKVIIGKWLTRDCDILIFDEPTRGIDVGAKGEIYKLLNELADAGKSIIMISSELPEILRMSHRICVMCEGRLTGVLSAQEATQESIMHFATMRETMEQADAEHNNQGETK
jgi:ribose transport system ATP-binding protein